MVYTPNVDAPLAVERPGPDPVSSLSRSGSHLLPDPRTVLDQGGFNMDDQYRCNIDFVDLCDEMGLKVSDMIGLPRDPGVEADQREVCRRLVAAGHSLSLAAEVMRRGRSFAVRAVENPERWVRRKDRCERCGVECVGRWCGFGKCSKVGGRWSWSTVVT